jgi:hypothetical protein
MSVKADPAPSRFATALPPILMSLVALIMLAGVAAVAWAVNDAINEYRDRISLKGLNGKPVPVEIGIGMADLEIPANLIRFPTDRRGGYVTAVDLLLLWPDLDGYSDARSKEFRDTSPKAPLIYVTITEADTRSINGTARASTPPTSPGRDPDRGSSSAPDGAGPALSRRDHLLPATLENPTSPAARRRDRGHPLTCSRGRHRRRTDDDLPLQPRLAGKLADMESRLARLVAGFRATAEPPTRGRCREWPS